MHDVYPTGMFTVGLWTHGESFRLVAFDTDITESVNSIMVTEAEFASGATITEVETIRVLRSSYSSGFNFSKSTIYYSQSPSAPIPITLFRGTAHGCEVAVQDARSSKILLHHQDPNHFHSIAFSSDGRFVGCLFPGSGVHIWKYSPGGYVLHGNLGSFTSTDKSTLLFSPNGDSVIIFDGSAVHLWHTKNLAIDSPVVPPSKVHPFLLKLLPDRSLAAFARYRGSRVTLLDIRSGAPQSTIDAGMEVRGLGMVEDTIVVIGERRATIWWLPGGSHLLGATKNVADSAQTIHFLFTDKQWRAFGGFISPDFRYIGVVMMGWPWEGDILVIYSATTGTVINILSVEIPRLWFTPDGNHVGELTRGNEGNIWKITPEGDAELLTTATNIEQEQWGCPYRSSHGYWIADDGWVFGPSGKRLLVLPPLWRSRSGVEEQEWNRQFLALQYGTLPEPVIIDLEP